MRKWVLLCRQQIHCEWARRQRVEGVRSFVCLLVVSHICSNVDNSEDDDDDDATTTVTATRFIVFTLNRNCYGICMLVE